MPSNTDPFLTGRYDRLHRTPMQEKFRRIAPMPVGVVFVEWPGMTDEAIRSHFRKMKELGFTCLKGIHLCPGTDLRQVMHAALDEGLIPWWYGAGGEMGLFLPFAARATDMEGIAETMAPLGSFYPSIHPAWHFEEVDFEIPRPVYMQASLAQDWFKGGWAATWESTGGPQQLSGGKGWTPEAAVRLRRRDRLPVGGAGGRPLLPHQRRAGRRGRPGHEGLPLRPGRGCRLRRRRRVECAH